jgi:hypothetical protein
MLSKRLPCSTIWGYEIHRYLNSFMDRRQESVPWLGLRGRLRSLHPSRNLGYRPTFRKTKVHLPSNETHLTFVSYTTLQTLRRYVTPFVEPAIRLCVCVDYERLTR